MMITIFLATFALASYQTSTLRTSSTPESNEASDSSSNTRNQHLNLSVNSTIHNHGNQLTPACIDHEGNIRDWYIAYKLPKLHESPSNHSAPTTGYEYLMLIDDGRQESMDMQLCVNRRNSCATLKQVLVYEDPNGLDGRESDEFWEGSDRYPFTYDGGYLVFKEILWNVYEFFYGGYSELLQKRMLKYLKKKNRSLLKKFQDHNDEWIKPNHLINDPQSAIVQTLNIAYQSSNDRDNIKSNSEKTPINSLFYNDELPVSSKATKLSGSLRGTQYAHAKGVVIINEQMGDAIWLSHSLPKFPSYRREGLYFHENSHSFGQTFMCISFNLNESGNKVLDHLLKMKPQVYDHYISYSMLERFPNLRELIGKDLADVTRDSGTQSHELIQQIETSSKNKLTLFSKDQKYGADIYSGMIMNGLNCSLQVQTWRRGSGGKLPSFCPSNGHHTENIDELHWFSDTDSLQFKWSYLDDHSKWAIEVEPEFHDWFCISDINRMKSQFSRGGGAICFDCRKCRQLFKNIMDSIETCPKNLR